MSTPVPQGPWARSWCVNPVPFDESGRPDLAEYRRHVRFVVGGGLRGLVPLGLVGGGLQLTPAERAQVIAATLEAAGEGVAVYPAVLDPTGAGELAERIDAYADLGAHGVYLGTPPLLRSDEEGTLRLFDQALRRSTSGLPVILYDNANFTGSRLGVASALRLAEEHGRVAGYKQNDPARTVEVVQAVAGRFPVAPPCYDRYTLAGIEAGCTFQAAAGAAVVPHAVAAVSAAWAAGDLDTVRRLTTGLTPLWEVPDFSWLAESLSWYPGIYAHLLARQGFRFLPPAPFGWPLPPWLVSALDAAWDAVAPLVGRIESGETA